MPAFSTEVANPVGQEAGVEKLKVFLDRVAEKFKDQVSHLEGNWEENILTFSLTTYGFTISGTLTVEEEVVKLDGDLPFAAIAFKGKITQSIAAEIEKALARGLKDDATAASDTGDADGTEPTTDGDSE